MARLTLAALALAGLAAVPAEPAPSRVAVALAFCHRYALPAAVASGKDRALKVKLTAALAKSADLAWDAELFDEATFRALAGGGSIAVEKMERLVIESTPQSRRDLHPKTRLHADLLSTQFDLVEEQHRKPADDLAAWVVKNYQPGKPLGVIAVCTGNTRRSMLSATMGNIAAAYHSLPEVRFYSGGTDPDAFNPRTVATLKEIGVEIDPTGKEAPRGKKGDPNPIYSVRWGKGLETTEFSKLYADPHNPRTGFAAILVCSEADSACPQVAGASGRFPLPFLDPKAFDGAAFESGKYAERRDDIGRVMLSVLLQARRRLELDGKLK